MSSPLRTKSTEHSLELVQELGHMLGVRHAQFDQSRTFTEVGLKNGCHGMRVKITRTALSNVEVGTCEHNSNQSNASKRESYQYQILIAILRHETTSH